jgi:hypothetical protein
MAQPRKRPCKTTRLNHSLGNQDFGAAVQILGRPDEVKVMANDKTFISVREGGISISPGAGNNISFQGLPQNMRYAGMLMDLPFPLSLIPTTPFTPWPNQIIAPPLAPIMDTIRLVAAVSAFFVG